MNVCTNVRPVNVVSIAGMSISSAIEYCAHLRRGQLTTTRDVLQRHQAVHEKDEAEGKTSTRRTKERAIEACEACATAKLSCDNERPCKVCQPA
jgi:hypothetical protein